MKARLLLMEDDESLRKEYSISLIKKKFDVMGISDGIYLENILKEQKFNIILSDTEMKELDGPEAVKKVIDKSYLNRNKVLIIGMSDDYENRKLWRGIAHYDAFFDKKEHNSEDISQFVENCWRNFNSSCKGWKMKILSFNI